MKRAVFLQVLKKTEERKLSPLGKRILEECRKHGFDSIQTYCNARGLPWNTIKGLAYGVLSGMTDSLEKTAASLGVEPWQLLKYDPANGPSEDYRPWENRKEAIADVSEGVEGRNKNDQKPADTSPHLSASEIAREVATALESRLLPEMSAEKRALIDMIRLLPDDRLNVVSGFVRGQVAKLSSNKTKPRRPSKP